jgi:hypothetical protein
MATKPMHAVSISVVRCCEHAIQQAWNLGFTQLLKFLEPLNAMTQIYGN